LQFEMFVIISQWC